MSNHIEKNNPNRWFYGKLDGDGADSLVVFGYVGKQGKTELETGLPILVSFINETELERAVNTIAESDTYYKDQVESDSSKFQGESGLYIRGSKK